MSRKKLKLCDDKEWLLIADVLNEEWFQVLFRITKMGSENFKNNSHFVNCKPLKLVSAFFFFTKWQPSLKNYEQWFYFIWKSFLVFIIFTYLYFPLPFFFPLSPLNKRWSKILNKHKLLDILRSKEGLILKLKTCSIDRVLNAVFSI